MAPAGISAVPSIIGSERRTRLHVVLSKRSATVGLKEDRTTEYYIEVRGAFRLVQMDVRTFDAIFDPTLPYWTTTTFYLVRRAGTKVVAQTQACLEEELVGNRCPPPAPATPPGTVPGEEVPPPGEDPTFPPPPSEDPPDPPPPEDPPQTPSEPVLNTVLEIIREEDEVLSDVVRPVIPPPPEEPPPDPELPPDPPPETPPGETEFHRIIENMSFNSDVIVPEGEKWHFKGLNKFVRANLRVLGTISMRPGDTLEFLGGIPSEYRGGGMGFGPGMELDFGLWIGSTGQMDIRGTPKLGWNRTGVHTSWLSGDEYWIAPTNYGDFAPRRWFPGDAIPRFDPRVPSAEIVNVTRDVVIKGVGHIHVSSSKPQVLEFARLEGLGITDAKFFTSPHDDPAISGRYALHLHMQGEGSSGSVFRGLAAVGCRGKVYVPHTSHGVTLTDCVSVNSWSSAFWWDEGSPTNDIMVDRLAVLGVELPWEVLDRDWSNKPGVMLPEGERMTIQDSFVAGVRGWDSYAGGFEWQTPFTETPRHWTFERGNVAHNNHGDGLRFWTNLTDPHYTANFIAYNNRTHGIEAGAYQNGLQWENGLLINNNLMQAASAKLNELGGNPFYKNIVVEARDNPAIIVGHRVAATHEGIYQEYINCSFTAGQGHPKVYVHQGDNPWKAKFIDSGVQPSDIEFLDIPGNEGSEIIIEEGGNPVWRVEWLNSQKVVTPL